MRVLVSGASGMIGTAIVDRLRARGDEVGALRRGAAETTGLDVRWDPVAGTIDRDALAAGRELSRQLPDGATVVVRDGARGCVLIRDGQAERVPAPPVEAVDTNGAGDAHCGVLAAELLRGADWPEAVRRANAAAALAVTRYGPATAPTRAEVDTLLAA